MIVDTHHHLWDQSRFRLPWLDGNAKLNRSHLMQDYFEATEGLNVAKTIYMEVAVEPSQRLAEAEYVLDLCQRDDNPMVAAVIAGSPGSPEFKDYLLRFMDSPCIKGVRGGLPDTSPGEMPAPEVIDDLRMLGELGMSFDLCPSCEKLGEALRFVEACPTTQFILDHCGNANVQATDLSQWRQDLADVAKRRNVVCKVSGIVASARPDTWTPEDLAPIVNHVINEFGWDRVMFGGDWPVCTLTSTFRQWVEALQWIVRDAHDADRQKLFYGNAVRFYGLREEGLGAD